MASDIDVANLALDLLGQTNIISFLDATKPANLCNRNYPLARDFVQRAFPWRVCKRRVAVPSDLTPPVWGYRNRFRIPADSLFVTDVNTGSNGGEPLRIGWEREGDYILTNTDGPLYLRYCAQLTDVNQWDATMVNTVAARLAVMMCESLTQDGKKKQQAIAWWATNYEEARHANGQEGTPTMLNQPDDWEVVRVAGGVEPLLRPISEVSP